MLKQAAEQILSMKPSVPILGDRGVVGYPVIQIQPQKPPAGHIYLKLLLNAPLRFYAVQISHRQHHRIDSGSPVIRTVQSPNLIGAFEVPDRRKIPEFDILMETRKGVAVNYAPAQSA